MKKKESKVLPILGKGFLFILKTPYYFAKGIYNISKRTSETIKKRSIRRKRDSLNSRYDEFQVIEMLQGDYNTWIENISKSDSKIGIILGARGTGKTAFGIKFLENLHSRYNKKCFTMGLKEDSLPLWIKNVSDISQIENNSFVLIDEGGILFNSRNSMSNTNKLLSQLIMIARHKNISILFISQNSSNLEINILRQADFLILKPSSLLQKEFERKIIQKIYNETEEYFKKHQGKLGLTHIYSSNFRGFVTNSLPSFWEENLSKGFK